MAEATRELDVLLPASGFGLATISGRARLGAGRPSSVGLCVAVSIISAVYIRGLNPGELTSPKEESAVDALMNMYKVIHCQWYSRGSYERNQSC
jgi:hypothetical protein